MNAQRRFPEDLPVSREAREARRSATVADVRRVVREELNGRANWAGLARNGVAGSVGDVQSPLDLANVALDARLVVREPFQRISELADSKADVPYPRGILRITGRIDRFSIAHLIVPLVLIAGLITAFHSRARSGEGVAA